MVDVEKRGNFVGKLSNANAETIIKAVRPGEYLIRVSERKAGAYTCVVNVDGRAVNCPLRFESGQYFLGSSSEGFPDTAALFQHHERFGVVTQHGSVPKLRPLNPRLLEEQLQKLSAGTLRPQRDRFHVGQRAVYVSEQGFRILGTILTASMDTHGDKVFGFKQDGQDQSAFVPEDCLSEMGPEEAGRPIAKKKEVSEDEQEYGTAIWFAGKMPRADSDAIIHAAPLCSFLVRESESNPGAFICVINANGSVLHLPVKDESGGLCFANERHKFPTLSALINFHMKNGVTTSQGTLESLVPADVNSLKRVVSARVATMKPVSKSGRVGEKAAVIVERVFRVDGIIVSQNLGADGVRLGFRPEHYNEVYFMKEYELCTISMDGTLVPLAPPPAPAPAKKKGSCVLQ
eukprot:m.7177 g.7177  ORF g.7177 m.7177 type:complete len:404 (-) comp4966_c0_seq1:23-1234(-)